jgi:phenylalanine-4-hydroxylase
MAVDVKLPLDHPGVSDPAYRARRSAIAEASAGRDPSLPAPLVEYSAVEHEVWTKVSDALAELHAEYATDEYRASAAALQLPHDRVPQLADVSERLRSITGWTVTAVPGLVPTRQFYGSLARTTFMSTQYVRHPSVPFYTPEPDVIHELIGHVNALASPRMAALYEAAGRASLAAVDDDALERFSRVFWFTIEFGLVRERGDVRTYGAGLLSSFGEIQAFRDADIRPFDIEAMVATDYDITQYQDVLFCADSFDQVESELLHFLAGF